MKKTIIFIISVCLISWGLAAAFYLSGFKFSGITAMIFGAIYMMIPMTVAIIVQKFIYKQNVIKTFMVSFRLNKWFIAALILTPLISVFSIFISLLIPGVSYSPGMEGILERFAASIPPEKLIEIKHNIEKIPVILILLSTFLQGIGFGATVNAAAAFGEELGWRGMLLNSFRNMSFIKASVIIGIIWGIWHFPLILMGHNYPEHNVAGVFMMTAFCTLLSPLFVYITLKTHSVIASAIMHGTLNGTAAISLMVLKGGNDLTIGITGFAGFITIALAVIVVFILDQYVYRDRIMTKRIDESL
jgi:uncharacterized protein